MIDVRAKNCEELLGMAENQASKAPRGFPNACLVQKVR